MKKIYTLFLSILVTFSVNGQCSFVQIGTDTTTNTLYTYPAPYGNYHWGSRHQMVILPSELTSLGVNAGPIIGLAFDVAQTNGISLENFSLKIGHASNLGQWPTNLQTIYGPVSYVPVVGWNYYNFSLPFYWNGVSYLVIETCFNNPFNTVNTITRFTLTGWNSTKYVHEYNLNVCGNISGYYQSIYRPNIRLQVPSDFNLIKGNLFLDFNNNLIQEANENNIKNHLIFELNTNTFALSNQFGLYEKILCDTGMFITSTLPIPYYWPAPITHSAYFSGINQIDSLNDFAFQPLGVFNDLKINISPITPFRPGFNASYNLHYKNIGTTSLAGSVVFYPDANISFVSSDITPSQISPDSVLWNLPVLNPFDEGDILVTVNVIPNASIGSMVNSGAKIEPLAGDTNPSNNIAYWEVLVTGAIDPNDILVNKETITTTELANSTYLEYLVRFQNTGNDTAFTVKVMNNITQMLDVSTFEFVNSSHPLEINYGNHSRLFEFKFENILLPDSNTNELHSHGFVRYRIKPFDTLSVGDLIENTAAIYFDFNAPVITNTAVTEVVLPTFVSVIKDEFGFSLYPNPTTGEINISFNLKETSHVKIELFNSLGQLVNTIADKKLTSGENKINFTTENIPKGIYHLKFSVDGNIVAKKVVKM